MNVLEPSKLFNFTNITLANPYPVQGGSYFTKLNNDGKPLCIQMPTCYTKQGIVSTQKNKYCDLMYDTGTSDELTEWIEQLELTCQKLINEKKQLWFHSEITEHDINNMMTPICRLYKSGKKILIRTNLSTHKRSDKQKCVIYNEDREQMDAEDVEPDKNIIPLVCIDGIRFTSRSFEMNIILSQIMILDSQEEKEDICLIKHNKLTDSDNTYNVQATNKFSNNKTTCEEDNINDSLNNTTEKTEIQNEEITKNTCESSIANKEMNHSNNDVKCNNSKINNDEQVNKQIKVEQEDTIEKYQDVEHQDVEHQDVEHQDVEHQDVEHQALEHQDVEHQDDDEQEQAVERQNDDDGGKEQEQDEAHQNDDEEGKEQDEEQDEEQQELESSDKKNINVSNDYNNSSNDTNKCNNLEGLCEVDLSFPEKTDVMQLRKPTEVYYDIYKTALKKATHMRSVALDAFLEAKNIKERYMLNDIDDYSDLEDFENQNDLG